MGKLFGESVIEFLNSLTSRQITPGVEMINPYVEENVKQAVSEFYLKYFSDNEQRVFIVGINPGRFGGGITGISFTDPVALREYCQIENELGAQRELSSRFIYSMINAYGGPEKFYSKFYLTALFPLALVKGGKNFNFYDSQNIAAILRPKIIASLKQQIQFGANRKKAICLGKKNLLYMEKLNREFRFFEKLYVLEHPRFIMQYKLKSLERYIDKYLSVLNDDT